MVRKQREAERKTHVGGGNAMGSVSLTIAARLKRNEENAKKQVASVKAKAPAFAPSNLAVIKEDTATKNVSAKAIAAAAFM